MTKILNDHRKPENQVNCGLWAIATDKFMSGWGLAPNKSYVAYPLAGLSDKQQNELINWMEKRTDFIRVRINFNLPRLQEGCHCSIYDVPEHILQENI